MTLSQLKTTALIFAIALGCAAQGDAQPMLRQHAGTKAEPVALARAVQRVSGGSVTITQTGRTDTITSKVVPTHAVGRCPNADNPNRVSAQSHTFRVPVSPKVGHATPLQRGHDHLV
ncbi:hypothetical protein [uncultured Tateyamaria sp.]|uniref:hypothetical protein n=1 Tax=uncultured Tateyamaria sp. TaxID=455651 RepID=UPI00261427C8|nr:hypothetical protein [uncultured Tateyamaria sp.]